MVAGLLGMAQALAVVQFQVEPADIPVVRSATLEFITIEGDSTDVEVDQRGIILFPDIDDPLLVRGGVLSVRPTNGTPAFSAAVPMDWDGVSPLVLDISSQSLVVREGFPAQQSPVDSTAEARIGGLLVHDHPLYYLFYRLSQVHELARRAGVPPYALDAGALTMQRWFAQVLLSGNILMTHARPAELQRTFLIHQILVAVFGSPAPPPAQEGLQTDECRVVSAQASRREVPLSIARISAEEVRLSGQASSVSGRPLTGTRVLLTPVYDPLSVSEPYWTSVDALPPASVYTDASGSFQVNFHREQLWGPQGNPFRPALPITVPNQEAIERAAQAEEIVSMYQALVAQGCFQARPIILTVGDRVVRFE